MTAPLEFRIGIGSGTYAKPATSRSRHRNASAIDSLPLFSSIGPKSPARRTGTRGTRYLAAANAIAPTSTDLATTLLRAGLGPEALAAAGASVGDTEDVVQAVLDWMNSIGIDAIDVGEATTR